MLLYFRYSILNLRRNVTDNKTGNMPYLILIAGLLIAGYAIYKFLIKANAQQIAAFIGMLVILIFSGSMIFLALTGRLPAAIAGVAATYPWLVAFLKWRKGKKKRTSSSKSAQSSMSVQEALDIMGLDLSATEEEIEKRFKELMKKHHPDAEGSHYFAQKLNEARKILLTKDQ